MSVMGIESQDIGCADRCDDRSAARSRGSTRTHDLVCHLVMDAGAIPSLTADLLISILNRVSTLAACGSQQRLPRARPPGHAALSYRL